MPDRNWKAFESPNKEFDENGDDDSKDLDIKIYILDMLKPNFLPK